MVTMNPTEQARLNRVEIDRDNAVKAEAASIMKTPVDKLDWTTIDARLRAAWKSHGSDDTYIAFVDRVYRRLKHYHARGRHTTWFRTNFSAAD